MAANKVAKKKAESTVSTFTNEFVQTKTTANTVRFDVPEDGFGDEEVRTIYIKKAAFKEYGSFPGEVEIDFVIRVKN